MARISIYEFKDYKKYVLEWINRAANNGRGQRKLLADAIGCQTPFITHVLVGNYQFSPEQAEACSKWMGLNDSDTEYFLTLVMLQRAGTKSLESFYQKRISALRERENVLKKRLEIQETLTLENQMVYYSSWHYPAVHMGLLNPALQSIAALQKYFQLPLARVVSVINFLTEIRMVEETKLGYKVLLPVIHLENNSPLITQHHSQWRLRAIENIQSTNLESLHYSGLISLSKQDYEWVQERLAQLLNDIAEKVKTSPDEQLATLCFDWFTL